MLKRGTWNTWVVALNATGLSFLALERLIGDTILGNVLLMGLAIILLLVAAIAGLADAVRHPSRQSVITLTASVIGIAYVILRVYFDSVPAGYGP